MVSRTSSKPRPRSRPLSAADWSRAAMDVIVRDGVAAVAVESLAIELGATKGSFYHHFENRDALIVAALEDWERAQTEAVIERLELIEDPAERLRAVLAAAFADRDGGGRDAALFASAMHPLVKPVVDRVTERRVRYFADMYARLGYPNARARRRALMLYLSYIGLYDYLRAGLADFDATDLRDYAREVLATLVTANAE